MLPSGYVSLTSLGGSTSAYIDTGVVPTGNMSVEISFGSNAPSTATGYVFGSRNTSSNSSQGQINLYVGALGSASYVGYNAARISKTLVNGNGQRFHLSSNLNDFTLVNNNEYVYEFLGTSGTFTGTRNIYLFGLNNGGTFTAPVGALYIYGFRLYNNGTLIRNMTPVYNETTGESGMYDLVNGTFYGSASSTPFPTSTNFLIDVDQTDGGEAFIKADGLGLVKSRYASYQMSTYGYRHVPITAVAMAKDGYVFDHWEIGGDYVSNEEEYSYIPQSAETIKAIFRKEVEYQNIPYRAMILMYNVSTGSIYNTLKSATWVNVLNADVNEDLLQRSTTTLECESIPSTVQINTPLFLYNPKGKIIYYGVVKTISDKQLICREPISLFDDDAYQSSAIYNSAYTTTMGVYQYMSVPNMPTDAYSTFKDAKMTDLRVLSVSPYMSIDTDKNPTKAMPLISETEVVNGEDRILNAFSEFGIAVKYSLYKYNASKWFMSATAFYPRSYDALQISDGFEAVRDVSIDIQEADTTDLVVFNSSGATYRGHAVMRVDGNIEIYEAGASTSGIQLNDYVAHKICKMKIVFSDDNLKTVALENLNGALYSHKITFTLMRNNNIRFADLHLGQRINFYYGGNLYESIITAWKYTIDKDITSITVTLGNVRTSLTAILNKKGSKK